MATIRIAEVSNRHFPKWVKEALLGLEFPEAELPKDLKPLHVHNFWGPPTNSRTLPNSGHCVEWRVFMQILREKNAKAADWFKEKTLMGLAHWVGIVGNKFFLVD